MLLHNNKAKNAIVRRFEKAKNVLLLRNNTGRNDTLKSAHLPNASTVLVK
ncbi:MAG: hypothetical protein IPH20_25650 [Bacteroidales bacterium]|nr:hypothetical protein [Bacteroidales bacterium]